MGLPGRVLAVVLLASVCAAPSRAERGAWVEVRAPHFRVVSDADPAQALRLAGHFEQIRDGFAALWPGARLDSGRGITVIARDAAGFRALLPDFFDRAGATPLTGFFLTGAERDYIAVQASESRESHRTVYHEYAHLLVNLNLGRLPLWLSEGLAEVYGGTVLREGSTHVAAGRLRRVRLLLAKGWISWDEFFAVGQDSPWYRDAGRSDTFYAQAWLIAHYIRVGNAARRPDAIPRFVSRLHEGANPVAAAFEVFGDRKTLSSELQIHLRKLTLASLSERLPSEPRTTADYPVVPLTGADGLAWQADFHLQRNRLADAEALAMKALESDPRHGLALETLAITSLRANDLDAARRWVERALVARPDSFVAHYADGMIHLAGIVGEDAAAAGEMALQRATTLNGSFAPAFAALAGLYSQQAGRRAQALELAEHAVRLEPGTLNHQLTLARVLHRLGRREDARRVLVRLRAFALTPDEQRHADSLLDEIGGS